MPSFSFPDSGQTRQCFDRVASRSGEDFLAREIARRMHERLEYIRIAPTTILDLGCGRGDDLPMLKARFAGAHCVGLDFSPSMLANAQKKLFPGFSWLERLNLKKTAYGLIAADAAAIPLRGHCVSVVWSNMLLPWVPLQPVLKEIFRVLEPGGMLMFSALGPDTLKEMRAVFSNIDEDIGFSFPDMHDLGDILLNAGFSDPVMDMEMLNLTYSGIDHLIDDLARCGLIDLADNLPTKTGTEGLWQEIAAGYERYRADERLPLTIEILQGHAWKKTASRKSGDEPAVILFHPPRT